MRSLDLFCAAGGASTGLVQAGMTVVGVDHVRRSYPYPFIQQDVLTLTPAQVSAFDFVWASPPCQFATAYGRKKRSDGTSWVGDHPNLIPQTRELLEAARQIRESRGLPFGYVIENVDQKKVREQLRNPIRLCGSSFGLDVRRHRLFEVSGFTVDAPPCDHGWQTPRFPPAGNRTNLRSTVEVGVWRIPMEIQHAAMGGLEWMTREELSLAIPPAYSELIARSFLDQHSLSEA